MHPDKEIARVDDRAQCYAYHGKNVVELSDALITSIIFVGYQMVNVLFDPSSTNPYVFVRFGSDFDMLCDILNDPIRFLPRLVSQSYHPCLWCFPYLVYGISDLG